MGGSVTRDDMARPTQGSAWAWDGRWWTTSALEEDLRAEARLLRAQGIVEGDLVAISGRSGPPTVTVLLAVLAIGAWVYPVPPRRLPSTAVLRSIGVRAVVHVGTSPCGLLAPQSPADVCVVPVTRGRQITPQVNAPPVDHLIGPHAAWPVSLGRPLAGYVPRAHILEDGRFGRDVISPLRAGFYLNFAGSEITRPCPLG